MQGWDIEYHANRPVHKAVKKQTYSKKQTYTKQNRAKKALQDRSSFLSEDDVLQV